MTMDNYSPLTKFIMKKAMWNEKYCDYSCPYIRNKRGWYSCGLFMRDLGDSNEQFKRCSPCKRYLGE
jgi:hypothetical protein